MSYGYLITEIRIVIAIGGILKVDPKHCKKTFLLPPDL